MPIPTCSLRWQVVVDTYICFFEYFCFSTAANPVPVTIPILAHISCTAGIEPALTKPFQIQTVLLLANMLLYQAGPHLMPLLLFQGLTYQEWTSLKKTLKNKCLCSILYYRFSFMVLDNILRPTSFIVYTLPCPL
jgi:hypothetical protein